MYIPIGYTRDVQWQNPLCSPAAAVRPYGCRRPESVHELEVLKIGHSRVIVPQGKRWDDLFQNGPRACEDFMVERRLPAAEEREPL
jgi:antitoxin VapB